MKLFLPFLLAVIAFCNRCDGLRILGLFPLNGKSHWVVGERLMISLAEKGHQVDVVTQFTVKNPLPNYKEISLEGSLTPMMNNMNASMRLDMHKGGMQNILRYAGADICNLFKHQKMQKLIKERPKYDVIVLEVFLAPCYLGFGRYLNAPMINLMASSFHDWLSGVTGNPHNPSYMPSLFSSFDQRMTFWERLVNTYISHSIRTKLNYYTSDQSSYVKEYLNIDGTIDDLYKDVALTLVNSHHSLNGIRPMTTNVIEVGGLHIKDNGDPLTPELEKWLNESTHGCILFTFGSMMRIESFPKPVVEMFYKVFEKIAPVRVLMKVARKEDLIPGLPKNVMIQPWFPQISVFKHKNTKAFITHGGLMSTQEAIYFGIPMIGIPLFGDQHTNLKKVANKKVAVELGSIDDVTEENLSSAINTILQDKTYSTNMKRLSNLFKDRPMSPIDTAIYWTEYVAKYGTILQSPALQLSWWQLNLLDVYGFVLACSLIVLYLAFFIIRKVKNCVFGCKSCSKKDSKHPESKKKK